MNQKTESMQSTDQVVETSVRPERGRKCKSGINGLDLLMDGGFQFGSTILVHGSACSGIDQFAIQFWRSQDSKAQYLMIDATPIEGMVIAEKFGVQEITQLFARGSVILDSLSSILLRSSMNEVIKCLADAKRNAIEHNFNHFFLLYKGIHPLNEETLLMRAVDVVIELNEEVHGNEFIRTLHVSKVSGIDTPVRVFPFLIMRHGIELSTTSRVV